MAETKTNGTKRPKRTRASASVKADAEAVEGARKKPSRAELLEKAKAGKKTASKDSSEDKYSPEVAERRAELASRLQALSKKGSGGGGASMLVETIHASQVRRAEAMGVPRKPVDGVPVSLEDFTLSKEELEACAISVELLAIEMFPTAMGFSPVWAAVGCLALTLGRQEYTLYQLRKALAAQFEGNE